MENETEVVKDLKNIGFYTLSDRRAERVVQNGIDTPMARCEMIITDKCNFKCPYCRGIRPDCKGEMSFEQAKTNLDYWIQEGLQAVRFSGGEPTIHPNLVELVKYCKDNGVQYIAISTNGSAPLELYQKLVDAGANDFSVSLDACCASFADAMAGVDGKFEAIVNCIKFLAARTYITVGIVVNEQNVSELVKIVEFADSLGVSDIRIISSAQFNQLLVGVKELIGKEFVYKYPILRYRLQNTIYGENVRGMDEEDSNVCFLPLDDSVICGEHHFPCVIYMREHGEPIGKVGPNMRAERYNWVMEHRSFADPICKKNCLDVCIAHNNKCLSIVQQSIEDLFKREVL